MNAIYKDMLDTLHDTLFNLSQDSQIRVVILSGEGKAFSAGVDLRELDQKDAESMSGGFDQLNIAAERVSSLMEESPKVIIAKINGYCFTGALEIALAADLLYAADEAKLGDTHAILGYRPTWGLTQRLPKKIGIMRSKELSFTAKTISGLEAKRLGLVLESFPLNELDDSVESIAKMISDNSPYSISAYKDLYRASENMGLSDGLEYEKNTQYDIPDVEERVKKFLHDLKGKSNEK